MARQATMQTDAYDEETGEVFENAEVMVGGAGALAVMTQSEIEAQVATARRYPRVIKQARDRIKSLVALDEATATECIYSLPRGNKPIVGPSIRMAEIAIQNWGNARCEAQVIEIDRVNKIVTAQGTFHDLETNVATRVRVSRRISDRSGRVFNDDMITVTGNAACSIARRNATFAAIPKAIWGPAFENAREIVAGTVKTLSENRQKAVAAFAVYGVKPEQVFALLGVEGIEQVTLDHIVILRGTYAAIKNEEATVEEIFDPRKIGSAGFEGVKNPLKDDAPAQAKPADADKDSPPAEKPMSADAKESGATDATSALNPVADQQAIAADASGSNGAASQGAAPAAFKETPGIHPDPIAQARARGLEAGLLGKMKNTVPPEYGTARSPNEDRAEEWAAWMAAHREALDAEAAKAAEREAATKR